MYAVALFLLAADPTAEHLADRLNAVRRSAGVVEARLDPSLCEFAAAHAARIARSRSIYHSDQRTRPSGTKECVAFVLVDPIWAFCDPVRTPGHREDALYGDLQGWGWAYDDRGTIYWVLETRRSPVRPGPPPGEGPP